MMTIRIKREELQGFQEILKQFDIRHGPFRKNYRGYEIDILDSGPIETYLRLKYTEIVN